MLAGPFNKPNFKACFTKSLHKLHPDIIFAIFIGIRMPCDNCYLNSQLPPLSKHLYNAIHFLII